MTLDVYRGRKTITQQQQQQLVDALSCLLSSVSYMMYVSGISRIKKKKFNASRLYSLW